MSIDEAIRQAVREEVAAAIHGVPRKAFTVSEVAQSVGVSVSTVRKWIDDGLLAAFQQGTVLRITAAELDRFLEGKAG